MAIFDNIDGSPISYNITYSDVNSGRICGTFSIPAATCQDGVCRHTSQITSPCSLSDDISLSVLSTNILGSGPPSQPVVFSLIADNDCSEFYSDPSMNEIRMHLILASQPRYPCIILLLFKWRQCFVSPMVSKKRLRDSTCTVRDIILWDVY